MGQAESNMLNQGPPHAQDHVEHDIGDPDLENWEFETRPTASDTPKGFPDVYVNGEDVTVTIDPMKNQHWIRDGSHRHDVSQMRGAIKDHAGVVRAQKIADKGQYRWFELPQTFVPSSKEIDAMPKLTPRCVANSSRGSVGTEQTRGTLPGISQMIYKNMLADTPDWMVENQTWLANTHLDRNRAFDCTGPCR